MTMMVLWFDQRQFKNKAWHSVLSVVGFCFVKVAVNWFRVGVKQKKVDVPVEKFPKKKLFVVNTLF